jgi:hypothetical protein
MLEMFKRVSMLALVLGIGAASASLNGQVQSTIVLKNGQRHTGRHLDYRVDRGEVSVRVGLHEQPRVRVDQVAYVDFGGTPDVNVQLSGSQNAVVMRDGSVIKGQIIQLGHETSDDSSPFLVIFRTSAGEERRVPSGQVARVYFSASPVATTGPEARPGPAIPDGTGVAVPGNQQWTPTGLAVRRGETFSINATGEVRLSNDAADLASPTGSRSGKMAANAPLPNVPAGALIGRIGNSAPFGIGDRATFSMPASGQLFLGINDDHLADNEGGYRVTLQRDNRPR